MSLGNLEADVVGLVRLECSMLAFGTATANGCDWNVSGCVLIIVCSNMSIYGLDLLCDDVPVSVFVGWCAMETCWPANLEGGCWVAAYD